MSARNSLLGMGDGLADSEAKPDDAQFDVTAMIDVVSLMNIYFLVTFVGAALESGNLPPADHCSALDAESATILTVAAAAGWQKVDLYIGDGNTGTPISDPDEQVERIADVVSGAVKTGKLDVLFKADKEIRLRDMRRLAQAASREGGVLHFAVMERDKKP